MQRTVLSSKRPTIFLLSCLASCSAATAPFVGPYPISPIANLFQFPVVDDWDCTESHKVKCAQGVGHYDLLLDSTGKTHSFCGKHLAEDIEVGHPTRVVAIADGVVRFADDKESLGRVVNIEHRLPDGTFITSVYMHLKKASELPPTDAALLPGAGSLIKKGDYVGTVTDNPDDNFGHQHLHFGIRNDGTTGYFGSDAIDLQRTGAKYYVGYSTHFVDKNGVINANGIRRCDRTPTPPETSEDVLAKDELNPDHDTIVANWKQPHAQLPPRQFIEAHLAAPPTPPSNIVTFIANGTAQSLFDPKGVLPTILSQPYVNVPVTAEIAFDKTTPDRNPSNETYGNYLPSSIVVTIGTNTPVTFVPEAPLESYQIGVVTSTPGSSNLESQFLVYASKFVCTGCAGSPAFQFTLTGGPTTYFATDALPTAPPDMSKFPSTEYAGTTARLGFCTDALAQICGSVLINVTSLTLKQ